MRGKNNKYKVLRILVSPLMTLLVSLLAIFVTILCIVVYIFVSYPILFIEGITDAYAAYKYKFMVCRHKNIATALTYNNSDIYVIMDKEHLRTAIITGGGYLVVIDVSYPKYNFSNKPILYMLHCHIDYNDTTYTSCRPIYIKADFLTFKSSDPVVDALLKTAIYPMNNTIKIVPLAKIHR